MKIYSVSTILQSIVTKLLPILMIFCVFGCCKKIDKVPIEMIYVQGGTFEMGSPETEKDRIEDEGPVHSVTVNSFYIGKYEVTQKQWKSVREKEKNPSHNKGDNLPVENIQWFEVVKFCNDKSEAAGLTPCYTINKKKVICNWSANGYRLPTEAEWEYAAKGGDKSKGYLYSGGNDIDDVAYTRGDTVTGTNLVGMKKPNELGIYDMSGNVYELCWDMYDKNYYKKGIMKNPYGASKGKYIVYRGGGWSHWESRARCSYRSYLVRSDRGWFIGFRVVRSADK